MKNLKEKFKENNQYKGSASMDLSSVELLTSFKKYLPKTTKKLFNSNKKELFKDNSILNQYKLPILLRTDENKNPIIIDFATQTSGIILGSSGIGKTTQLVNILLNFTILNSYKEHQFILFDIKNSPVINQFRYVPHTLGYHTDSKTFLDVIKEVTMEMERRKNLLQTETVENIHILQEKYKKENKYSELESIADLTLVFFDQTALFNQVEEYYREEEQPEKYEEFVQLLRDLVSLGLSLGIRCLFESHSVADKNLTKDIVRQSSLKFVYKTPNEYDLLNMFGYDSGEPLLRNFKKLGIGDFYVRSMGANVILKGKNISIVENSHENLKAIIKVIGLDWQRRIIDTNTNLTKKPKKYPFNITFNRNIMMKEIQKELTNLMKNEE